MAITAGRGLRDADPLGAVLEADYAKQAKVVVGDRINLAVAGHRLDVVVRGLGRSPEYLLATSSPEYLIPQPGSLAVVFLPRDGLARALGIAGRTNDVILNMPAGVSQAAEVQAAAGLPIARIVPRAEQFSLRFTEADLNSFGVFVPIVGAIFAAVGFLLIALTLRRLVHSQRRELGTLLAIGYRRRALVGSVAVTALTLTIPAVAV